MSGWEVKTATLEKCRKTNKYLRLDAATRKVLTCDICMMWKAKQPGTTVLFHQHVKSKFHEQALRLEDQEQAATEMLGIASLFVSPNNSQITNHIEFIKI